MKFSVLKRWNNGKNETFNDFPWMKWLCLDEIFPRSFFWPRRLLPLHKFVFIFWSFSADPGSSRQFSHAANKIEQICTILFHMSNEFVPFSIVALDQPPGGAVVSDNYTRGQHEPYICSFGFRTIRLWTIYQNCSKIKSYKRDKYYPCLSFAFHRIGNCEIFQ